MAVIFSDAFTDDDSTSLVDHTPTTAGDSWTLLANGTVGDEYLEINTNELGRGEGDAGDYAVYTADATYSSADYYVEADVPETDYSDDTSFLLVRIQDVNNMYAVKFNSQQFRLWKCVSGSWSGVGTDKGEVLIDGQTVKLKIEGTTLSAYVDDVEKASETVSDHSSAGKAGLGMGGFIESGDDLSVQTLDNFIVTTLAATGTNMTVNVDDAHKDVATAYVNVDDAWKEVDNAYVNVDDAWKTIY